jgi:shikimate dehydrogenase
MAMASSKDIEAIQSLVSNSLNPSVVGNRWIAGVIGDSPSQYSKSPALWNAAFCHLGIDAVYLPLDVDSNHVGALLAALRHCESFLGINVTTPHKVRVIDWLDGVDADAGRIQAVNTIVKTPAGRLIGYNTDGEGFIDSLLYPSPDQQEGFMTSLSGINALLLGAGGSARAVAFHLSDHIGSGKLIICNRTAKAADSLVREIQNLGRQVIAIDETNIAAWAPQVSLIVNSTVKGQGGVRKLVDGKATLLEPYSSLSTANPPVFSATTIEGSTEERWRAEAKADIEANNRDSETVARSIPEQTRFYDLIYHPEETVFLRHGRLSGHKTMNGKNMIVCQAVNAFCKRICQSQLASLGMNNEKVFRQIAEVMYRAW